MKNIRIFYLKIFIFLVVKSVYLNRRVFVMLTLKEQDLFSKGAIFFVL